MRLQTGVVAVAELSDANCASRNLDNLPTHSEAHPKFSNEYRAGTAYRAYGRQNVSRTISRVTKPTALNASTEARATR
jgi:hypothetical protein